ncbi:MAG: efflux RND transporter periplasmic adaptor subunit [Gammaproteobacteria bacterium]|nr:efflux RND transporter periplasmic adaptor subunit [Gammaproteobacteria bacterium]MCP5137421.1 efflux RND transporter periplasmic adaptor subunit [Gammaproteobacteria bacterium]
MKHPIRFTTSLFVVTALLVACGSDTPPAPSESLAQASTDTALEHAQKHLDPKYVCPMHPQIVRDEEGTCPICGMNLVAQKVSAEGSDEDDGPPIVRVRPETIQNMGVRTAKATVDRLWKRIDTLGRVMYDEDRQIHVHARAEGWVEKLNVRSVGDPVNADQVLLELYAPDIVNAQEEYLLALKDRDSGVLKGRRNLVDASVQRLRLFDVPGVTIKQIENTGKVALRVPIRAEKGGVVTQIGLREGMYVTPMTELYTISDISKVWVLVDVFEHQMGWFEVGTSADIALPALPGETFSGKVRFIYPELDPKTRTLRVRLEFDNADGKLKPNMLAEATIWGGAKEDVLTIPREAIIETGKRRVVLLALGDGRFQPAPVRTGMWTADKVEILSGLQPNAEVVVSGQFLIDSESNLQAALRRMQ